MSVFEIIYGTAPYAFWLTAAAALAAVSLASGAALPMRPAAAAAAAAALAALAPELGLRFEALLFAALAVILTFPTLRGTAAREPARGIAADAAPLPRSTHPRRLIGRIARSSGEFANGVGRVWIDGAEWAAELEGAYEALPQGRAVRVVRVLGEARLQVHPVAA